MRRRFAAIAALVLAAAAPAASAEVTVEARPSGEASPLVWRSANERQALFAHLARTLTRLGRRDLPEGRSLEIRILDVRPAGRFEPWRPGADSVRILRDTTPPSVRLSYRLVEGRRTLTAGEETVSDINYLWDPSARSSLGSFPYETELVRDWFRDRIVRRKPPRS